MSEIQDESPISLPTTVIAGAAVAGAAAVTAVWAGAEGAGPAGAEDSTLAAHDTPSLAIETASSASVSAPSDASPLVDPFGDTASSQLSVQEHDTTRSSATPSRSGESWIERAGDLRKLLSGAKHVEEARLLVDMFLLQAGVPLPEPSEDAEDSHAMEGAEAEVGPIGVAEPAVEGKNQVYGGIDTSSWPVDRSEQLGNAQGKSGSAIGNLLGNGSRKHVAALA